LIDTLGTWSYGSSITHEEDAAVSKQILMDASQLAKAVEGMAVSVRNMAGGMPVALVGIRTGGEHLAKRMGKVLDVPVGVVDITLYRDDGFGPKDWPEVGVSQIPFDVTKYLIVLVDDVLFTGRTVRAAIDAILDYGRPKAVRLAVLVDRGLRELPIAADMVGMHVDTQSGQHVEVMLVESGADNDSVSLTEKHR
jgi:pyrimidine operon attenuation protein/uracil phosphoribosyltransferase